jgi:hypothetical protein
MLVRSVIGRAWRDSLHADRNFVAFRLFGAAEEKDLAAQRPLLYLKPQKGRQQRPPLAGDQASFKLPAEVLPC